MQSQSLEEAATAAAITTGVGADVVIFEKALTTGGTSLPILVTTPFSSLRTLQSAADLGAGADSLYGARSSATAPSVVEVDKIRS